MSGDDAEMMENELERLETIRRADPENKRQKESFMRQLAGEGLAFATTGGKSLGEKTNDAFSKANLSVKKNHPRNVEGIIRGMPRVTRIFELKANQVADWVEKGTVAFGITGYDNLLQFSRYRDRENLWINRKQSSEFNRFEICAELPYSRNTSGPTRAVLFTRADNPISSIEQMSGKITVATEYDKATAPLLERRGISATLVECTGNAEACVVAGVCDYGVALVDSGDTLRVNDLKIICEIFKSNTVFIANKAALDIPAVKEVADFIARKLKGVLTARERVYLVMNAPVGKVGEILSCLQRFNASMRDPTVAPLLNGSMYCSIATVVWAKNLNEVEMELARIGADSFVELETQCIM